MRRRVSAFPEKPRSALLVSRLMPICFFALFLNVSGNSVLSAAEFFNGRIKLVLHENTGHFSLYYLTDIPQQRDVHLWHYESFFVDNDPRTTFLTVMANDRTYRLGESPSFRMRIRQSATNPAIIFESSFLLVTQEFSFIKTADSPMTNGIRMNVWVENRGTEQMAAGFRFLLDTNLGEGSGLVPYYIGQQAVSSEFIIDSQKDDPHWISRNNRFGLMGSVSTGEGPRPDAIHFANWKRLSEVSWKLAFIPNRNYNYLPYSINDSAVSYVFDPQPLARGGSRKYVIFLAMMDENGFLQAENTLNSYSFIPDNYTMGSSREEDLIILRDLITRLEDHLAGRVILSEGELTEIESAVTGLKARYGLR